MCCPSRRIFGPDAARGRRDRPHRRTAARGAGLERPLCAQRRQRPLGQPLRRALRHRRHPRGGRRRARGSGYNKARGAKVVDIARAVPGRGRAARRRQQHAASYAVEGGTLVVTLHDGTETGLSDPAQFVGYQGDAASPTSVLLRQTTCISTSGSTASTDRRRGSGRHRRSW